MKLDIQLFGGRGAVSTGKRTVQRGAKASTKTIYYNKNIMSYRQWWEDNLDNLADRFEAKYNKEPVNGRTGRTHPKWDSFTESEYANEKNVLANRMEKRLATEEKKKDKNEEYIKNLKSDIRKLRRK